ncbi:MAG TPA: DUF4153 domain-containing protein [Candidatus Methylacidiphilales bacterium]|nr:DUF4153 domain-containing protein [Candidatus Methylacidiphilales bacterium]
MNGSTTAELPTVPAPYVEHAPDASAPPVRLLRLLCGMAATAAVFDLCFWEISGPGFSVAVFFLALAGIILANREMTSWKSSTRFILALMAGTALASLIEVGFSNVLVWLILTAALAGDTYYDGVESPWGRWLSQMVALLRAPGRVFWLGLRLAEAGWKDGTGWASRLVGICLLSLPALVLTLIFGALLASGNTVFGNWTGNFFNSFWNMIVSCLNPGRILMWCFVAFLALPLLRPANISAWWWNWALHLPSVPEIVPARAALLSSGLTLLVLNLLFFGANLADAIFLWAGAPLPPKMYTAFVHHGVNTLIFTVILSAVVLTSIFQQAPAITGRRILPLLAYLWIAQNVFLLGSVGERLRRYIMTYIMTVPRLELIIFLILVAVGFTLLTIKIAREKSLSWLAGGCLLAVFATFYISQFLNLAGWSADYNVARWERGEARMIDVNRLYDLGMPAWPALRRVRDINPRYAGLDSVLSNVRRDAATLDETHFDPRHWREFSLHAWWNHGDLHALLK